MYVYSIEIKQLYYRYTRKITLPVRNITIVPDVSHHYTKMFVYKY